MGQNWKLTILSQKVESPPLGGLSDILVTGGALSFQKLWTIKNRLPGKSSCTHLLESAPMQGQDFPISGVFGAKHVVFYAPQRRGGNGSSLWRMEWIIVLSLWVASPFRAGADVPTCLGIRQSYRPSALSNGRKVPNHYCSPGEYLRFRYPVPRVYSQWVTSISFCRMTSRAYRTSI